MNMITRKELSVFTLFCRDMYNLEIDKSITDDFMVYQKSVNKSETKIESEIKKNKVDCDLGRVGCSHLVFNSAKCDGCVV